MFSKRACMEMGHKSHNEDIKEQEGEQMTLSENIKKLQHLFKDMEEHYVNFKYTPDSATWVYDKDFCDYYLKIIEEIKDAIIDKE